MNGINVMEELNNLQSDASEPYSWRKEAKQSKAISNWKIKATLTELVSYVGKYSYWEARNQCKVLSKVIDMCKEGVVNIPDTVTDRAKRIGINYVDNKNKRSCKSIIGRFTTLCHRTMVCWAKKSMIDNERVLNKIWLKKGRA